MVKKIANRLIHQIFDFFTASQQSDLRVYVYGWFGEHYGYVVGIKKPAGVRLNQRRGGCCLLLDEVYAASAGEVKLNAGQSAF